MGGTHVTYMLFSSSCSAQMLMKGRLKGAQKGHSLLKKKADALQMRFRLILSKIIEVCTHISFTFLKLIFQYKFRLKH